MSEQRDKSLSFGELISGKNDPQTIYGINNACISRLGHVLCANNLLRRAGNTVYYFDMKKRGESSGEEEDLPPPDYVFYTGCARAEKDVDDMGTCMDICVGGQAIKGLFLMGCIKDVNDNFAGEPFDKYLREQLGFDEDFPITHVDELSGTEFGFISDNTYLIESGCSNRCGYCMGHYVDNREPHSADRATIIADLQKAYDDGLRVVKISGENTALFGVDKDGERHLHELIWDISAIGFTSVFIYNIAPQNIYPELVEALRDAPHIDGIKIAVETADEPILESVGRGGTADVISDSVREIRSEKPWFYVGVNMVTGLPGETDETHERARKYLRDNTMVVDVSNRLHSHDSLPVSKLLNQVDTETAERRARDLYELNGELVGNYVAMLSELGINIPLKISHINDAADDNGRFKQITLDSPFAFGVHSAVKYDSDLRVGDTVRFFFDDAVVRRYATTPDRPRPEFYTSGYIGEYIPDSDSNECRVLSC